jgi:peptide/nickel transport system substrate-binding protein
MQPIWSRWLAATSIVVCLAGGATRPQYGGTLRVEIREAVETPDPPQDGPGIADLGAAFSITRWEGGRSAVYTADPSAPGGLPFLDGIEIQMARPLREQAIDLELGKADLVELGPNELRRATAGRRVWRSAAVRLLALEFGPEAGDPRVREALGLSVDRAAIHSVLLQRQGEIAGGLLPQWISGYAFLFPTTPDPARARSLIGPLPPALRTLNLSFQDPAWRALVDRIAVNARDAGLMVNAALANPAAEVRLVEVRITSADPWKALAGLAASLALTEPPHALSAEALFAAERNLLADFRVIPLLHLPYVYGVGPRVRGGPGITPLGEWRFEKLWLEGARP